ncbi:hypothetical protein M405DRAFT_935048 [Rhizopogon salebrosus TDB-379]|nr:hypothetical protein M405DRAFT_935048 [Rhizopogon salebrosus TDB-379]
MVTAGPPVLLLILLDFELDPALHAIGTGCRACFTTHNNFNILIFPSIWFCSSVLDVISTRYSEPKHFYSGHPESRKSHMPFVCAVLSAHSPIKAIILVLFNSAGAPTSFRCKLHSDNA